MLGWPDDGAVGRSRKRRAEHNWAQNRFEAIVTTTNGVQFNWFGYGQLSVTFMPKVYACSPLGTHMYTHTHTHTHTHTRFPGITAATDRWYLCQRTMPALNYRALHCWLKGITPTSCCSVWDPVLTWLAQLVWREWLQFWLTTVNNVSRRRPIWEEDDLCWFGHRY